MRYKISVNKNRKVDSILNYPDFSNTFLAISPFMWTSGPYTSDTNLMLTKFINSRDITLKTEQIFCLYAYFSYMHNFK